MNIIRNIFSLKVITVFALVALFMASLTITPTEARLRNRVMCPCQFYSTFLYLNPLIYPFGGKPDLCFSDEGFGNLAIGGFNGECRFRIETFEDTSNSCLNSFSCDTIMGGGNWGFEDLSPETLDACDKAIQTIIRLKDVEQDCGGG